MMIVIFVHDNRKIAFKFLEASRDWRMFIVCKSVMAGIEDQHYLI